MNSHFLWNLVIVDSGTSGTRKRCQLRNDQILLIVYWMDFATLAAIPCLLLLVFNCCIVLRMAQRKRRLYSKPRQHSQRALEQQQSLTVTLLVVSFAFLLTTLPVTVYFIVAEHVEVESTLGTAKLSTAYAICNLLYYTGSAINFVLYVLTAQRFRAALLKQLTSYCWSALNKENRRRAGDTIQAECLCSGTTSLRVTMRELQTHYA